MDALKRGRAISGTRRLEIPRPNETIFDKIYKLHETWRWYKLMKTILHEFHFANTVNCFFVLLFYLLNIVHKSDESADLDT